MMTACNRGAQRADPDLQVSWPGTTGWDFQQLQRTKGHLNNINGGELAADAYVVNHYWNRISANIDSDYRNASTSQGGQGAHPEAHGGTAAFMAEMVARVKSQFPNAEVRHRRVRLRHRH